MKSFSVGLLLCFSLSFVFADHARVEEVEKKAIAECNATNPVHRSVGGVMGASVIGGYRINFTQEEKCHLLCFLQKVKFLNEDGNIYDGQGLVNFTIRESSKFAPYSEIVIASVFQIGRSIKGIEDKCHKAFVAFHQFLTNLLILEVANLLEKSTGVKDEIVKSIETGNHVNVKLEKTVEQYLEFLDILIKADAQRKLKEENTSISN